MCDNCGETRCWCNSSDWGEELLEVENVNPTLENKTPSPKNVRNPQQDGLNTGEGQLRPHKKIIETY